MVKCDQCHLDLDDDDREYKKINNKTFCSFCYNTMLKDTDGNPLYFGYMVED